MNATERLLAQHQDTLNAAVSEARRLRDELMQSLSGLSDSASLRTADLDSASVNVDRLLRLQGIALREDQAVRRLTARAMNET